MTVSDNARRLSLVAVAITILVLVTTRLSLVPTGIAKVLSIPPPPGAADQQDQQDQQTGPARWITSWTGQGSTLDGGDGPAPPVPPSGPVRRVFVVGCGHSGTSLLYRSIGNMPGVRCLRKETQLFIKNDGGDDRLRKVLADWDGRARRGGFFSWVEKSPRHVYHIGKILEMDPRPNNTRIIFIHRDGRDVSISFKGSRGYSWQTSVNRWVDDNTVALPFLDNPAVLVLPFEELMSAGGVLRALRRVAGFLDIQATDVELALSLMPGTQKREYQDYCTPYNSDAEKMADLAASVPAVLAGKEAPTDLKPAEEDIERNLSKYVIAHNQFRTWQMAQAWTEIRPPVTRNWTAVDMQYFYGRSDVRGLMKRFGYPYDIAQEDAPGREAPARGVGGGEAQEEEEKQKEAEVEEAQQEADAEDEEDYGPPNV